MLQMHKITEHAKCSALCFIAFKIKYPILFWNTHSHLFEEFESLVAQHKMQSNRLIYRTLVGGPFSILAMNECVNDIRINLLPQKGRASLPTPSHRSNFLWVHTVRPSCAWRTKCKPYFDTLNRILSFSWHNKLHSTSGKPKSIRKSQNIVWKREHTQSDERVHCNWIQTNSILVIWCLDGDEHSINGFAISVKTEADCSTSFFPFSISLSRLHWANVCLCMCRIFGTHVRWFSVKCSSIYCKQ